jgi:bifunctional non-homologous end joining protein LigD
VLRVVSRLRFIEPQLASLVEEPPEGKHWIHEVKHDGYRCQVLLERGQARVFTRNGFDWTDRYPGIARAATRLRCRSAIIDGEAIVQKVDGASDFEALSSAMRYRPQSIILYAFDLLHLDGKDLRQETLLERRANLQALVGPRDLPPFARSYPSVQSSQCLATRNPARDQQAGFLSAG